MFKGMGGLGDMAKMMGQVKELQSQMEETQARMDDLEVSGEAGAGLVTVRVNGKGVLKGLTIDPSIFVASEKEVVEDLIIAAVKDGQAKAEATKQAEMGKLTDGLPLPEGFKLPF